MRRTAILILLCGFLEGDMAWAYLAHNLYYLHIHQERPLL